MSLIQKLLISALYLHPATSWPKNPSKMGLFPYYLVSWELCPLQRSACLIKNDPVYNRISVCFHMQPHLLILGTNFTYLPCKNTLLKIITEYPKMWCEWTNYYILFSTKKTFDIQIWRSNLKEPPQVYSLILAPPFFFSESTYQWLK